MTLRRLLLRAAALLVGPAAATGLVAFTVLRLSGRTVRWSSSAVAFTPSVAAGGAALTAASTLLGRPRAAVVLATSTAVLGAVVAPRARPAQRPNPHAGSAPTLRVLSANCLKGRADAEALVALVRELRPDVLALQEQNRRFIGRLEAAGLFELMPHRVLSAGGRLADTGLVSRFPLAPIAAELPSVFTAAEAELPGGRRLPLVSFHPLPPVGREATAHWADTMRAVPAPAGAFAGGVVCGDFNATLDHPELRAVLGTGWRDAAAERGHGLRATWSEFGVLRLTIDHILVPPGGAVVDFAVHHLPGSDHRAISATLTLPPAD